MNSTLNTYKVKIIKKQHYNYNVYLDDDDDCIIAFNKLRDVE